MKRNSLYILISFLSVFIAGSVIASEVDIHGFLAQGFMQGSDNNFLAETEKGTFEFNEMGINFSTNATSNLKLAMQFFARDLGDVGNDEMIIDWVFGDYSWKEWLGLRVGMLKTPTTLYSDTRDVDSLRTSILLPQSVYNEWFRDFTQGLKGLSVYGNVSLSSIGLLQYEFQISDVAVSLDSGTAKFVAKNPNFSEVTSIGIDRIYLGGLKWHTPLDGFLLGVSGFKTKTENHVNNTMGAPMIFEGEPTSIFLSAEYIWNDLTIASECWFSKKKSTMYLAATPNNKILDGVKAESTSYYVSASYKFLEWFEAGTYYSESIADDDKSGADNELIDIALSTKFDINDYWTVKLEGHSMDGLFGVDANEDGTTDENWFLYLAKVSYMF